MVFFPQQKYVLDLLIEAIMFGCKLISAPIEQNHKLYYCFNEAPTNKGRYQKLVRNLIYLSHTRPNIAYAVNLVRQFMPDP